MRAEFHGRCDKWGFGSMMVELDVDSVERGFSLFGRITRVPVNAYTPSLIHTLLNNRAIPTKKRKRREPP